MYSILNKLVYRNEIIGLRILIECSEETHNEEILDLDMDLVYKYEIDYGGHEYSQLEIIEKSGVFATEEEHKSKKFIKNVEDFYSNNENFLKDIYENMDDGSISMGIKLGELSDCDFCPFRDEPEFCSSYSYAEPPCANYPEMSFREYEGSCVKAQFEFFEEIDKREKMKKEKEEKDRAKKARARSTRIRNKDLNKKIANLRKQKEAFEDYILMQKVRNITNKMISMDARDEIIGLGIYEEELKRIDEKIEDLIKERKERNREFRNSKSIK